MKKYISIALVFLAAACNTIEQPQTDSSDAVIYIQATGEENLTKGSVDGDDATFTWNTGDRIAVYTKSGYVISRALSSADDGEASANFPFSSTGNYALVQADREDFAIFPASLVWDGNAIRTSSATNHDADNLTLTLPARYELSQVQNNVSPTPMIATNVENGALAFKALCPLLRLTVNNIPKQTKRIEFDFNGKKVQGEFTLTGIDMSAPVNYPAIETTAASDDNDIITVSMAGNTTWHDYLIFNLPVPAGTYGDITITAYDATSGGNAVLKLTKALKAGGLAWAPTRASSSKMTATLPVFSVADGKKVVFAPGNLVAVVNNPGTDHKEEVEEELVVVGQLFAASKWYFADNQYDYNFASQLDGTNTLCDHFGWVGENAASDVKSSFGLFNAANDRYYGYTAGELLAHDWGENVIFENSTSGVSFVSNTWRSPIKEDWLYVMNERTSDTRYAKATVNDVKGLIIFPDGFSVTDVSVNNINKPLVSFTSNEYNVSQWSKLESAGAVFLPAAGFREGSTVKGANTARYWSKTVYAKDMAFSLNCYDDNIYHSYGTRKVGYAVRLVREMN